MHIQLIIHLKHTEDIHFCLYNIYCMYMFLILKSILGRCLRDIILY